MRIQACMGGKCGRREHCQHYHAEDRRNPSERLCLPGQDGVRDGEPIRVHRPAGSWELPSQQMPKVALDAWLRPIIGPIPSPYRAHIEPAEALDEAVESQPLPLPSGPAEQAGEVSA